MRQDVDPKLLTIAEAASRLSLAQGTLRNWVSAGILPAIRVRGAVRLRADMVNRIAREGLPPSAPETGA